MNICFQTEWLSTFVHFYKQAKVRSIAKIKRIANAILKEQDPIGKEV